MALRQAIGSFVSPTIPATKVGAATRLEWGDTHRIYDNPHPSGHTRSPSAGP